MAIKKSDLYSSLWASCDELRGGMDASQYKDYVLFMLSIKYVSDKYGDFDGMEPPVTIPTGASFQDMIALKGKSDIGDRINKEVIAPLVSANARLARTDFPDFNDPNKLGEGDAMVRRLENLIGIFQKPELDFSKNRADNDDILGDAKAASARLRELKIDCLPKDVIREQSEALLAHAEGQRLIDPYAVYQHFMDYWAATMQDDCYLIAADGWVARTARILETDKKGKTKDKGWTCDLVPKPLIVARYFAKEQAAIDAQQTALEAATASLAELEEEYGGEGDDQFLGALDKIAKNEVSARLKEIKGDKDAAKESDILRQWLQLNTDEADLKRAVREAEAKLDQLAYEKYPQLTETEIKTLVVDDKWLTTLAGAIQSELDRVSQTLTSRIRQLADRYATPLPQLVDEVAALAAKVDGHLKKMQAAAK